ncbi:hypothetical protein LLB_3231 [Legionella longbeachae D-4968]|nr:hypothetical protein LLB_3231 [Legionella longbeachae D-4968]
MYRIHYSAWQWLIQKTAWSAMINKASNFRLRSFALISAEESTKRTSSLVASSAEINQFF